MRSIIKHKSCTIISCTIVLLFIIAGCPSKDKDDQKSEETPTVRKQKIESAVKEKTQLNTELVEAISKNKYGIADSNGDNVDSNITAEHLYKGQRQSPTGSAKEQGQALPGSVNETSDLAGGNLDVIEPDLSQDLDSSKAISEIKHALNDKDAQIREDAVNRLVDVDHPSVATLVIKALGDISEDVRTAAMEVALEHDGDIGSDVMEIGISSGYADVKYNTLMELEFKADHKAVEIIIKGLDDDDINFCTAVNETLEFLIDKNFDSYQQAQIWWDENKHNYDDELFRKDDN